MIKNFPVRLEVDGRKIIEISGDFHTATADLNENYGRLITPRDEAYARIESNSRNFLGLKCPTWTNGYFEYAKDELPIFIMGHELSKPKWNRDLSAQTIGGNIFYSKPKEEYNFSLSKARRDMAEIPNHRGCILLPSRDDFATGSGWDDRVLETILKDQAERYYEFNGSAPIKFHLLDKEIVDSQERTIIAPLLFGSLSEGSPMYGDGNNLSASYTFRASLKPMRNWRS